MDCSLQRIKKRVCVIYLIYSLRDDQDIVFRHGRIRGEKEAELYPLMRLKTGCILDASECENTAIVKYSWNPKSDVW